MDENVQRHRAFVETVACGSLTKAAKRLYCSQSSVSRMISDLEREWGVTLLRRDRAGVELTSVGALLLPVSQNLCDAYQAVRDQVDVLSGLVVGHLRIGTISSVATHCLPQIIQRFRADYPDVSYELLLGDYSEIERWLKAGRVDCGFLRVPCAPGIDAEDFLTDELMAVLPKDHELAQRSTVPLEALCNESFLALEHGADTGVAALFALAGLQPNIALSTWDDYAIMAMVEAGLGVAILPSLILKRIPYEVALRPLDPPAYRHLGFAVKTGSRPSLALSRFRELLERNR